MTDGSEQTRTSRFRLKQESITVMTVGIALAGVILTSVSDLREEGRADRAAWQAESQELREAAQADRATWQAKSQELREAAQADRAAWQAESRQLRDENRAGREAFERRMEALQRQVVGLSIEQAKLAAAGQGE